MAASADDFIQEVIQDPASLGNLLLKTKAIDLTQLREALAFQSDNPDIMLGEALIRMGLITRDGLNILLTRQKAMRGGSKEVRQLLKLATKRNRDTASECRSLHMHFSGLLASAK